MTLVEQLNAIKQRLKSNVANIVTELREKGVAVDDNLLISQIAAAIRQIHQSDFNFIFDFRSIDQFGNPHVPNTGNATNGMFGMPSTLDVTTPVEFVYNESVIADSVTNLRGVFGIGTVGFIPSFNLEPTLEELEEYHTSINS